MSSEQESNNSPDYSMKYVPKFHSGDEALEFIKKNPEAAHKIMNYRIVTDYEELEKAVLSGITDFDNSNIQDEELLKSIRESSPFEYGQMFDIIDRKKEVYMPKGSIFKDRLINTLRYLYYHMKMSIYCRVEDNKIKQFIVFVNVNYKNNWSKYLTFEGENGEIVSMEKYYQNKRRYYRKENVIKPENWWANAHVIDNEPSVNIWGPHLLSSICDLLYYATQTNKLKNTSFFINKRDYPMLRKDLSEPYSFLHPKGTQIPKEYIGKGFVPIHSYFSSEAFLDIVSVTTDDWDTLTGMVTLAEKPIDRYSNINYEKYKNIKWEDKINRAYFRGSNTQGVDENSNQRTKLAKISYKYNNNSVEPKENSILDAGIVTYNIRDKKINFDSPVTFTRKNKIGVPLAKFVPMAQGMKNKYLISCPGHSQAARFLYLMKMKVLILKIESIRPETDELWFFPLLKPYEDFVPVKADLSDLFEQINWCINNDDKAKNIAKNAYKKYRTLLAKTNVLKYYAYCINSF